MFKTGTKVEEDDMEELTRAAIEAAKSALKEDADMAINLAHLQIGDEAVGELAPLIAKCQKLTKVEYVFHFTCCQCHVPRPSYIIIYSCRSLEPNE